MSALTPPELPPDRLTTPQEPTTATPSVADYLSGLSAPLAVPRPSFSRSSANRVVVTADPALITTVLQLLVERSGMTQAEISRQMAIAPQSLNQYLISRRSNPSALWLARLAELVGARLLIEFPSDHRP